MASVTQRISEIKQPQNGYLPISSFEKINFHHDDNILFPHECIHSSLVGSAVDYLTRYMFSRDPLSSFRVSLLGAKRINEENRAIHLLDQIKGLDDTSIQAACNLVSYDIYLRNIIAAISYLDNTPAQEYEIDSLTISHIRCMVERSVFAIKQYGQYKMDGIVFEGGYTDIITSGDADFATADALWDMKVSTQSHPSSKDTLQLLIYYILGCHSKHKEFFNQLSYLAIINPRKCTIHRIPIEKISPKVIHTIENTVICYGKTEEDVRIENHKRQYERIKNGIWLNIVETCELLGLAKKTVYSMGHSGYFHPTKKGTAYYYDPSELLPWCDEEKPKYTFPEWWSIAEQKFGSNRDNWKFRCPLCGDDATVEQFKPFSKSPIPVRDACHNCFHKVSEEYNICNYHIWEGISGKYELALGGVLITDEKGRAYHAFDFADSDK